MGHVPAVVCVIKYAAGGSEALGTTFRVRPERVTTPEKCAAGAGSIEMGPISIRYVPSTSNVPSARRIGCANSPRPHPTTRSHPLPATDRQAPSPAHLPAASGASPGLVGLRLQAARLPQTTITTTNRRAVIMRGLYNARCTRAIKLVNGNSATRQQSATVAHRGRHLMAISAEGRR
jgi:hypothetical protein